MDFKKILTNDILPFWLDNAIDHELGGIMTYLDKDGEIYSTDKSVWFQGRALWTFSKAYNFVDKNPKYLEAAKKIYEFLPKCIDTDNRMFFLVSKDGSPIQKRRYYFSETFAAIGCAEYYRATGDIEVWKSAEKYFDIAKMCYDHPELNPPKLTVKMKSLSPVMIMLATARSMAACAPDPEKYNALARHYLDGVLHGGFISDELGAVLEHVSPDGKFVNSPMGRTVNPGHSLETAWFLMVEGMVDNNQEALEVGKKIIDITMPFGLDKEHGGIISFCDVLGKPATALEWNMKLWWPQNEAAIANKMAYEIFKEDKYNAAYESILNYALDKFSDKEHGEWYGYLNYDSTVSSSLKGNLFKGPFHIPRMFMILNEYQKGDVLNFFK